MTVAGRAIREAGQSKNNRNGALKAFAVPFERAFKASEDVRHLNVVVVVVP